MTKILVLGGAGFVGSNLSLSLLDDGHEVVCLDNLGSGREQNLDALRDDRFEFVKGDICSPLDSYLDDPESIDQVYHLASRASPADFRDYSKEIARTNTRGTFNVLEFVTEYDATLVYASTSEVYGEPEVHPQEESYRGNVNIRGPRAPYDEGKRFGETLCSMFHREYGTDARTVRIFNTYGPRMRPDDGRVIPTFIAQALRREDLTVHGEGTQTRSFCYVDDLVHGLRAMMEGTALADEVVNLGHTNEVTINELADVVADIAPGDVSVTNEPRPEDDPSRRQPDISRAKQVLDWQPRTSLREGILETMEYFKMTEGIDADT